MISYKTHLEGLGLTEEEVNSRLQEFEDESKSVHYIKSWEDLDKTTINEYRFSIVGGKRGLLNISKNERVFATMGLYTQPTINIEMYLVSLGVNVMVENRILSEDECRN